MFEPSLREWNPHDEGPSRPRGGVAPLRRDLALSHYLEKQAAHRASSAYRRGGWNALHLYVKTVLSGLIALRALRVPLLERRRTWAG
jgi:hypothetical protein